MFHPCSPVRRLINLASRPATRGSDMRQEYQAELAEVNRLLVTMAEGVRAALHRATGALLNADRTEAEEVVHADAEIDAVYQQVEDKVYDLLARQAARGGAGHRRGAARPLVRALRRPRRQRRPADRLLRHRGVRPGVVGRHRPWFATAAAAATAASGSRYSPPGVTGRRVCGSRSYRSGMPVGM